MTAPADCLVSTKVLFSDHTFFSDGLRFITNNCSYGSLSREAKNEDFLSLLPIIYPKIDLNVVRQFCPCNNLAAHIRENTDLLWEKPQKLCLDEFRRL